MSTDVRSDPYRAFNFEAQFGVGKGSFSECSGLTAEGDAVDYREGLDMTLTMRKLRGLLKYPNIVLKRGYTQNDELWRWFQKRANGIDDRRDGSITLLDEERKPVMSWAVENAWIIKIEGPTFNAGANEVAIESVELVHEGLMLEFG